MCDYDISSQNPFHLRATDRWTNSHAVHSRRHNHMVGRTRLAAAYEKKDEQAMERATTDGTAYDAIVLPSHQRRLIQDISIDLQNASAKARKRSITLEHVYRNDRSHHWADVFAHAHVVEDLYALCEKRPRQWFVDAYREWLS